MVSKRFFKKGVILFYYNSPILALEMHDTK